MLQLWFFFGDMCKGKFMCINRMTGLCVHNFMSGGYYNEAEASRVVTICSQILQAHPHHLHQSDIAVVAAYNDQVSGCI